MYAYAPEERAHLRERLAWTLDRIPTEHRTRNQVLGTKRSIGCVALEVTQRCNLDCSICYLSEHSEGTPDLPLETIMRRIQLVRDQYGVGTNVQITGGDPTLRGAADLERIVRRIVELKLVPALFTNGVHASRELLTRLKAAGLVDVAFHVDLTEKRPGYSSEVQLHEVREAYIERARGLGLNVIFNQTVFARNVEEVPELVRFYLRHADVVGMASFQLQADTGRGLTRKRQARIDLDSVGARIDAALGVPLSWENVLFGHPRCHRIGYALVLGDQPIDLFDDRAALEEMLHATADTFMDRTRPLRGAVQGVQAFVRNGSLRSGACYWGRRIRENWRPLLRSGGRIRKLSFFMQNFQDRSALDHERVDACSFHTVNDAGGVSMCVHNAWRDHYLRGGVGYPAEYQEERRRAGFPALTPGMALSADAR